MSTSFKLGSVRRPRRTSHCLCAELSSEDAGRHLFGRQEGRDACPQASAMSTSFKLGSVRRPRRTSHCLCAELSSEDAGRHLFGVPALSLPIRNTLIVIFLSLFSVSNAQDSAPETVSETAETQEATPPSDANTEPASEGETADSESTEVEEASTEPPSPYQPLLDNSPFMSKAFKARMAESSKRSAKGFSFQGYAKTDGEWIVCVFHSKDKFARWIKVGEEIHGYKIAELDPKAPSITISGHGTQLILQLENPK